MKKLFGLVALLALSFVFAFTSIAEVVRPAALNMVSLKTGTMGSGSDRRKGVDAFLVNNGNPIDFAYFYNMTSAAYFGIDSTDYELVRVTEASGNKLKYVFAYRTGWTLVKTYDTQITSNPAHPFLVNVVKDSNDQEYAVVLSGGSYDATTKLVYYTGVKTKLDAVRKDYPNARVYLMTLENMVSSYLIDYLTGDGGLVILTDGRNGEGVIEGGMIFGCPDPVQLGGGGAVEVMANEVKGIVGEVTYTSAVNVTFKDSLSDAVEVVPTAMGSTPTPPEPWNHEDIGYDFVRWEGDYSHVLADCEVLAVYAKKTHDVRFVTIDDDGSTTNIVKQEAVEWGTAATAPADPERAGYMFMGWDPADFSCVKSDLTIVAQFEELSNVFHVRFLDSDGVTILKEEDVAGGGAATAPADPAPHKAGDIFYEWDPADFSHIEADTDIVAVFGPAVCEVATVDEFAALIANTHLRATARLVEDLDFSEVKDYVSPTLVGTLDGNGHTVSGLKGNVALVDKVLDGTIRNLKVANFVRECTAYGQVGGLVVNRVEGGVIENVEVSDSTYSAHNSSCNMATIAYMVTSNGVGAASVVSNCVVRNCRLSGVSYCGLGGVVGFVAGGSEIVDCSFIADDKATEAIGGSVSLAGGIVMETSGGRVTRCSAEGFFAADGTGNSANNTGVGGIVGGTTSNGKTSWIVACTNAANVVATTQSHAAGGILGRVMKATVRVEGCVNLGSVNVSGDEDAQAGNGCGAGGIVGGGWGNSPSANVYVSNSKNLGTVTSQDVRSAGGIVGSIIGIDSSTAYLRLTNCINAAAVSSQDVAGGLAGHVRHVSSDVLSVVNCGNVGTVSAATNVAGGIIGRFIGRSSKTTDSYVYNGIANVMNCGVLSTESGAVGQFVGYLEAEPYGAEGLYQNIHRLDLQGFFCLDHPDTELAGIVVGKEGTGVTVDETSVTNLAASAFTDRKVVKKLNVYADANDLPLWVQTKDSPDLSLFSAGINFGLMILVR